MSARRAFGGWVVVALIMSACRAHQPAPIEPVPPVWKTETDVEISATSIPSPRPARSKAAQVTPEKLECRPTQWRKAANNAFAEQERWSFDVRWGFIKAGEAVLAVEGMDTIRRRPAYHLSIDMHATGMTASLHSYRERTDSYLDKDSLTTLLIRHSVRESRYQADETMVLDPTCQRFRKHTYRLDNNTTQQQEGPLPPETLDVYGALFYIRTQSLAVGNAYNLTLFAGDKAVPITAHVRKKELLKGSAGEFDCYLIELTTQDPTAIKKVQGIRWWLSSDDRHLPVRIQMDISFGRATADLQK